MVEGMFVVVNVMFSLMSPGCAFSSHPLACGDGNFGGLLKGISMVGHPSGEWK